MIYVWKDWKEQSRGKGIWLSLSIVILVSLFVLFQSRTLPLQQGFQVFLLSLHEMNVYLLPILSMFMASFSVLQEKEQKTLLILLTKKESYVSFLLKKSLAIQTISLGVFMGWYFLLALPSKFVFLLNANHFIGFLFSTAALLLIFNQFGILWGTVCSNRMQVVGANLFTWFFFTFLMDLISLYILPYIDYENVKIFSVLFFLNPVHTLHFYLETSLGLFPLDHMSRLMDKMVWLSPRTFLILNMVFWMGLSIFLSIVLERKGNRYD